MGRALELEGQVFNGMRVLTRVENSKENRTMWRVKCFCGKDFTVSGTRIRNGKIKSCGCILEKKGEEAVAYTHGGTGTRLYSIWGDIKGRCYRENNVRFSDYGGRGIVVCDEWKDDFQAFQEWSMNNGYRDELSIDRINNDKGYSPDNCRWTTSVEQNRNKRVHKNSRSGVSGVQWQKQNKKWIAVINTGDKSLGRIHLGSFSRIDEAIRVRRDAELKHWGYTKITSEQIEEIYNSKENFSKAKEGLSDLLCF